MSNSPLVDFTCISPNSSNPRKGMIQKITIHHTAGKISIEALGNTFKPKSRGASANYGVDSDGRVGLFVEEKNRAWTSSSPANDHIAVTIEVSNDGGANWHVSDKALQKTIELCADICKRNGIEKLIFTGDKNGNLTMHKYFAATGCPGPYLESKFPYIADEVNKILAGNKKEAPKITELTSVNDIVWELHHRGIISDKNLWLNKLASDTDAYWLARKCVNALISK